MSRPRSPLLPIFLTVFVDVLGLTLVLPLLPFYAEHFGASPFVVGTLAASYAACQLVSGPILGRLSDRIGRKPVLLASQIGTFIGFLTIGSATTLWMLFLGRIIDGLTAGNLSIAQAYISDVTKPEDRTKSFALIGIAFGSGFLIGPAISGLLAHRFGYASPAYGAAALSLTSILVTWRMLPNTLPAEAQAIRDGVSPATPANTAPEGESGATRAAPLVTASRAVAFGAFFRRPRTRRRLLEFFAFTISFSTLIGGLALFLERRFGFDVERTGYVFALSGLVGAAVQGGLIGRLVKKLGEARLTLLGFVTMAVAHVLLSAADSTAMLRTLIVVGGFGVAVVRPCLTTLLTKSVGPDEQGAVLGVNQSLSSIAQICGPLIAGFLIQRGQLAAWAVAAGAFAIVGAVLILQPEQVAEEGRTGAA